jgi:hypothetical protein
MKQQRPAGIGGEFAALAALIVRVEHEPGFVSLLDQHHPHRWQAIRGGGRHSGRLRRPHAGAGRLLKPARELPKRIAINILLAQRPSEVRHGDIIGVSRPPRPARL